MTRKFELDRHTEIELFNDKSAIIRLIDTKYSVPLSSTALDNLERILKWR